MVKIQMISIDLHRPKDMIIEVEEKDVEKLLKQNQFIIPNNNIPNETWLEKDILNWIKANNIPIKYNITNDEKIGIINKLKEGGYIK